MSKVQFNKIALVGIGLIGSSLARVIRERELAETISVSTRIVRDAGTRACAGAWATATRPRRPRRCVTPIS